MAGNKNDSEKAPMHFLTREFLEGLAKAQGFGAKKYGDFNFCEGIQYTRLLDATMRHLIAFTWGETEDPESKLNHIYHAAANLNMLSFMIHHRPEMDDRYKAESIVKTDSSILPGISVIESSAKLREMSEIRKGLDKHTFLDFSKDISIKNNK